MYQTLIALSTYVIFYYSKMLKFQCKFRIDNFSIVTMSKRRLFEELFLTGKEIKLTLCNCITFAKSFYIYFYDCLYDTLFDQGLECIPCKKEKKLY